MFWFLNEMFFERAIGKEALEVPVLVEYRRRVPIVVCLNDVSRGD